MKRLAIIAVLALAACGPSVTSGIVTAKHFTPAHDSIYLQPIPHTICTGGKVTSCTTSFTYIPVPMHYADKWTIDLLDVSNHTGTVTVSGADYERVDVGDRWPPQGYVTVSK